MENVKELFGKLVEIIAELRGENGCPWDKKQTHETLKFQLIEEAYEVLDAIDSGDSEKIEDELGDLLMQVLLNAQIAEDEGKFNICGVIKRISEKLERRHPHVFGDIKVNNTQEIVDNWEAIKSQEATNQDRKSALDGVPKHLPELMRARKIQSKASRVGFDWSETLDVLEKVEEEVAELKESISEAKQQGIEEEIGDILFSVVNLSRFLDVEPEGALRKATNKFTRRFKQVEAEVQSRGDSMADYDLAALDELWDAVKQKE